MSVLSLLLCSSKISLQSADTDASFSFSCLIVCSFSCWIFTYDSCLDFNEVTSLFFVSKGFITFSWSCLSVFVSFKSFLDDS